MSTLEQLVTITWQFFFAHFDEPHSGDTNPPGNPPNLLSLVENLGENLGDFSIHKKGLIN